LPNTGCWSRGTCSGDFIFRRPARQARSPSGATRRHEVKQDAAPDLTAPRISGGVHTDTRHDSAHKHVNGSAVYIDDMPEPAGTLHGCLGLSNIAHGTITSMDLSGVQSYPGVVAVITGKDVPGHNDISPTGLNDEPVLATGKVQFHGQPVF